MVHLLVGALGRKQRQVPPHPPAPGHLGLRGNKALSACGARFLSPGWGAALGEGVPHPGEGLAQCQVIRGQTGVVFGSQSQTLRAAGRSESASTFLAFFFLIHFPWLIYLSIYLFFIKMFF